MKLKKKQSQRFYVNTALIFIETFLIKFHIIESIEKSCRKSITVIETL